MKHFVIGYYYNEQGQQYATVVVETNRIEYAVYMMRRTATHFTGFRAIEQIYEISEKEIMDIRNDNDIYNQVEILEIPQDYKDYCNKLIEDTLYNAAIFY